MKNLLFTLSMLLVSALIKAQPYRPLLLDSSYWRVNYNATQMNCSCSVYYLYKTDGDTLINSVTYKKIIRVGVSGCSTCGPYSGAVLGSLRQDSLARKVYIVQNGTSTEKILYDFTQQVGDTVKSTLAVCPHVISSVDSVLINSVYHRRINIQSDGCLVMPQSFIEGIGSTQGLLEPLIGFEFGGTLVCAGHKNQVIYPSNTSSCSTIVTGIDDIAGEDGVATIFPNPGTGTFHVRFNTNETYSIKVFSVLGNVIITSKENMNETILIMNDKPKGVYFLELRQKNFAVVKKIVLE